MYEKASEYLIPTGFMDNAFFWHPWKLGNKVGSKLSGLGGQRHTAVSRTEKV